MLKFVFINVTKLIFLDLKNKKKVLYVILEDIYDGDVHPGFSSVWPTVPRI